MKAPSSNDPKRVVSNLFRKTQADTVYTMSFICGGVEALALKHVTKMTTTIGTSNLDAFHSKSIVFMTMDGTCKSHVSNNDNVSFHMAYRE